MQRIGVNLRQYVGPTAVGLVIAVFWALAVAFIVVFYLPVSVQNGTTNTESANVSTNNCLPQPYSQDICRSILQSYQSCLPERTSLSDEIFVSPESDNQEELEQSINFIMSGLELLNPSPECETAVLPFLCRYVFPLCDNNSRELYLPSSGECDTLTTDVCRREWQLALSSVGDAVLPRCNLLPPITPSGECSDSNVNSTVGLLQNTTIVQACSEHFFLEDGQCKPDCASWTLYPGGLETAMFVLIIFATVIGTIGGAAVLILSCINCKRAYMFPSALVRYQAVIALVYNVMLLITISGRESLLCSSRDLLTSVINPSPFCTFTGVMFVFTYHQLTVWWISHIVAMFWGLRFPFQAHRFDVTGKNKYLHLCVILLGLTIPWIVVGVVIGVGGTSLSRFPPLICSPTNRNVMFYAAILPVLFAKVTGFTLLVLIFWMIYKDSEAVKTNTTKGHHQRKTEVKVLIIVCYFFSVSVLAMVAIGVTFRISLSEFQKTLGTYIVCESTGTNPEMTCDRSDIDKYIPVQVTFDIAIILLTLFPIVNLIYAVNVRELKQLWQKMRPQEKSKEKSSMTLHTVL